jgi:hypothetical protein
MNNFDDVAWTRLLDMQREMESRRFRSAGGPPQLPGWFKRLLAWVSAAATRLAGRFVARLRRQAAAAACDECDTATDVA